MPLKMNNPIKTVELDTIRIAAFKLEDNQTLGRRWCEIWTVIGRKNDDGVFIQYPNPYTGTEEYQHFKIEDGIHPLKPNRILDDYNGLTRLLNTTAQDLSIGNIKEILYNFLVTEKAPDLKTGEEIFLIDTVPEMD
jgi:hypothetical protein